MLLITTLSQSLGWGKHCLVHSNELLIFKPLRCWIITTKTPLSPTPFHILYKRYNRFMHMGREHESMYESRSNNFEVLIFIPEGGGGATKPFVPLKLGKVILIIAACLPPGDRRSPPRIYYYIPFCFQG